MNTTQLKVADIVFASFSNYPMNSLRLEGAYKDFFCNEIPEVTIHGFYNGLPDISLREKDRVFDSGTFWSFYRVNSKPVLVMRFPGRKQTLSCIGLFSADFRNGYIYYSISGLQKTDDGLLPHPLAFPVFHLLMISLLSQGNGVLIHASGVDDSGKGYLFTGSSTHGKTTMARLWENKAVILNDERIVLRMCQGSLWIYGTPWHGEFESVSPHGVPLEKIFFLSKASANRAYRFTGITTASKLLTHCFLPFWDSNGIQFVLNFCSQIVADIPCYVLDFVPNHDIVDFVRCVK